METRGTNLSASMLNQDQLGNLLRAKIGDVKPDVIYVLAIRGNEGPNRIGVFDDRAYVVFDWTLKGTWKMNTDPSSDQTGRAHLLPGVYDYQAGKHHINNPAPKGRPAFIQAGKVNIHRTNQGDESGWYGINLHDAKGGTTSSLGCQTWNQGSDFYNDEGTGFRDVMYRILGITPAMVMAHPSGIGKKFKYILMTADEVTKILTG